MLQANTPYYLSFKDSPLLLGPLLKPCNLFVFSFSLRPFSFFHLIRIQQLFLLFGSVSLSSPLQRRSFVKGITMNYSRIIQKSVYTNNGNFLQKFILKGLKPHKLQKLKYKDYSKELEAMVVCALITSGMRITDTNLLVFLVIQPIASNAICNSGFTYTKCIFSITF